MSFHNFSIFLPMFFLQGNTRNFSYFPIFLPEMLCSMRKHPWFFRNFQCFCLKCCLIWGNTHGLLQLQTRITFPFLLAKDLRRFLLIMRTHSFLNSPVRRGYIRTSTRRRPAPSTLRTNYTFLVRGTRILQTYVFCWPSLSVSSGKKYMHVTESITKDEKWWGRWQ